VPKPPLPTPNLVWGVEVSYETLGNRHCVRRAGTGQPHLEKPGEPGRVSRTWRNQAHLAGRPGGPSGARLLLADQLGALVPELGVVAGQVDEAAVGGASGSRPAQRAGVADAYGTLRVGTRGRYGHASTISRDNDGPCRTPFEGSLHVAHHRTQGRRRGVHTQVLTPRGHLRAPGPRPALRCPALAGVDIGRSVRTSGPE
jgi:hypothetical protein